MKPSSAFGAGRAIVGFTGAISTGFSRNRASCSPAGFSVATFCGGDGTATGADFPSTAGADSTLSMFGNSFGLAISAGLSDAADFAAGTGIGATGNDFVSTGFGVSTFATLAGGIGFTASTSRGASGIAATGTGIATGGTGFTSTAAGTVTFATLGIGLGLLTSTG